MLVSFLVVSNVDVESNIYNFNPISCFKFIVSYDFVILRLYIYIY